MSGEAHEAPAAEYDCTMRALRERAQADLRVCVVWWLFGHPVTICSGCWGIATDGGGLPGGIGALLFAGIAFWLTLYPAGSAALTALSNRSALTLRSLAFGLLPWAVLTIETTVVLLAIPLGL
jgi:hypothetical protein